MKAEYKVERQVPRPLVFNEKVGRFKYQGLMLGKYKEEITTEFKIRRKKMLKGKSVIELTDVRTDKKEIYEDENLITNAVFRFIKTESVRAYVSDI